MAGLVMLPSARSRPDMMSGLALRQRLKNTPQSSPPCFWVTSKSTTIINVIPQNSFDFLVGTKEGKGAKTKNGELSF